MDTERGPAYMLVANGTLTLAEAVARLYSAAGWPWLRKTMPVASADDAQAWIDEAEARGSAWLDYINNRPLKIDLDELKVGGASVFVTYDRDNGEGRGAAALGCEDLVNLRDDEPTEPGPVEPPR